MTGLTVIVLGSAAGGGVPQWNCCCAVCSLAWAGDRRVKWRTQSSIAVSADRLSWTIVNASPDIRMQIAAVTQLRPQKGPRSSPVAAVVLTGAEIDQTAGLLSLRERQEFLLYGTEATLGHIAVNPMFAVLDAGMVQRRAVALNQSIVLPGGVTAEFFAVRGKLPLYAEHPVPAVDSLSNTVGVDLFSDAGHLVFVPGCAAIDAALADRLAVADVILFDGTLFHDEELIRSATGSKTGPRMGHVAIGGPGGSVEALARLDARRIYIHLNNTNPVLIEGSPEQISVERAGWEIAEDGMEIRL